MKRIILTLVLSFLSFGAAQAAVLYAMDESAIYSIDLLTGSSTYINGIDANNSGGALAFATVVPIPAAVYLFASGLGLLGWFRK
jgi:hypothetical protein